MDRSVVYRAYLEAHRRAVGSGDIDLQCGGYDGEVDLWYRDESGVRQFFTLPWDLNEFVDFIINYMEEALY